MNVVTKTEAAQFLFLGIHKWDFRCSVSHGLANVSFILKCAVLTYFSMQSHHEIFFGYTK
jgi:hypothetical protein